MATFSMSVTHDDDTAILNLSGELDIATVSELRQVARRELDRPRCTGVVLDLADLTFLDSTGIGSWIEIRSYAVEAGKTLTIRSAPETVRRILEIGGLYGLFVGEDVAD